MQSVKSRLYKQSRDGTAFKLGEISGTEDAPNTDWSEELWGSLVEKGGPFVLLKQGGWDSKYSSRNLRENNSKRAKGQKGEFIEKQEKARDWIQSNGLSEENLENFVEAYELLQQIEEGD